MAENSMRYKDVIEKPELNFWIPIIIAIASVATSFAILKSDLKHLEGRFSERVEYVDRKIDKQDTAYVDIQVRLAEIQKDILFIKDTLGGHVEFDL